MKGRYFIFTGLQIWDQNLGSNAVNIAKEIAKNNFVLYVNSPLDYTSIISGKLTSTDKIRLNAIKNKKESLRKISDSLWVLDCPFALFPINKLPDGNIFDLFNYINNKRIFRYTAKIAEKLGFKDIIHFIDNDIYRSFYSKDILKPYTSVYYRRDNLLTVDFWKKHALRLEPEIISKSDLVLCNSPQLAKFAERYNNKSYSIGQGVDLTEYNIDRAYETPENIKMVPKPIVGYVGIITSLRLDADLLYDIAEKRPEISFVMVGKEDKYFESHRVHQLKNVYFLGSVSPEQVPAYTNEFNICINPQLLNELTNGNYPRKVDEYLALGKPVIATKTDTMQIFADHVYLCENSDDYLKAIDKSLVENDKNVIEKRIDFAKSHSWEKNAKSIYEYIDKYK